MVRDGIGVCLVLVVVTVVGRLAVSGPLPSVGYVEAEAGRLGMDVLLAATGAATSAKPSSATSTPTGIRRQTSLRILILSLPPG